MLVGTRTDAREKILTDLYPCPCCNRTEGGDAADYLCYEKACSDNSHICERVVTTEQAREMGQQLGCQEYLECSARYRDGTRRVFEQATLVALRKHRRRRSRDPDPCIIL